MIGAKFVVAIISDVGIVVNYWISLMYLMLILKRVYHSRVISYAKSWTFGLNKGNWLAIAWALSSRSNGFL